MTPSPVLEVRNLSTHFGSKAGVIRAVDDVSFVVNAGEIVGLVGESGSGKSMTALSIVGLIDPPGKIIRGHVHLNGRDLLSLSKEDLRKVRGGRIAMVFQDPTTTLNPVLKIGTQITEAVRAHQETTKKRARQLAHDALAQVGISDPTTRMNAYPHQLSGGMRQQVAIAIALINQPELIIADEPTTALDVTIQSQIIYEIQKLCSETGTSLIWISHDLPVVASIATSVGIMYAGKIVEFGRIEEIVWQPLHPYTAGLIKSIPGRRGLSGGKFFQIPGVPASPLALPSGCSFRTRCRYARSQCTQVPELQKLDGGREVRCWFPLRSGD